MSKQWYEVKQQHNLGYRIIFFLMKICPAPAMRFLAIPVGFFYFLFGKGTRAVSRNYLSRCFGRKARSGEIARHIISFALNLIENIQSWMGVFSFEDLRWQNDDISDLVEDINAGRGTVIVISHLGNAQMLKGLASLGESGTKRKVSVTTISDENISGGFYTLLSEVNHDYSFNHISTDDIGPETILLLQERLEEGGTIVIAGDRVSAHTSRNLEVEFFGEKAKFPYGVFLMVALLDAPTYFVSGLRQKDISVRPRYDMLAKKNPVRFDCPRKEREERIKETARLYAENLETLCKLHPYQWYNFFDFWA